MPILVTIEFELDQLDVIIQALEFVPADLLRQHKRKALLYPDEAATVDPRKIADLLEAITADHPETREYEVSTTHTLGVVDCDLWGQA